MSRSIMTSVLWLCSTGSNEGALLCVKIITSQRQEEMNPHDFDHSLIHMGTIAYERHDFGRIGEMKKKMSKIIHTSL